MRHLILLIMTIASVQAQPTPDHLMDQYSEFKESMLTDRRFKHTDLLPLIEKLPSKGFKVEELGKSFQGRSIHLISIGSGPQSAFLWSQMHGNEATATMALFDIFNYLSGSSEAVENLLDQVTIYFIPMLNPDGAQLFQRRTSQGFDMNRDALALQCPESRILKDTRDRLKPDFGFNLHDQSIYYNVGNTPKPATISFLAPAYNEAKEVNELRGNAMKVIAAMNEVLQSIIPGQVGKYDDTFEPRAFGDNIQKWGTSTILIESGGYTNDPEKQFIRQLNYVSILSALYAIGSGSYSNRLLEDYWEIPMNSRDLNDLIIRNVTVTPKDGETYHTDIAIQREEYDEDGYSPLSYQGRIVDMGDLSTQYGYHELDASNLLFAIGKIYNQSFKNQQQVLELDMTGILQQGVTRIILEQLPSPSENQLPFDLISEPNQAFGPLKIEQPATFVLMKNDEVVYSIINGNVFSNEFKPGLAKGWIY